MANDFRLRLFHGTQKFWFVFLRSGFGSVNPPEKKKTPQTKWMEKCCPFFWLLLLLFPPFPLLLYNEDGGEIMRARFRDARSRYIYNNPCIRLVYIHTHALASMIFTLLVTAALLLLRLLLSGSNQLLPPSSLEIFSSDTGGNKSALYYQDCVSRKNFLLLFLLLVASCNLFFFWVVVPTVMSPSQRVSEAIAQLFTCILFYIIL